MGVKTWMIVYGPAGAQPAFRKEAALDRVATAALAQSLFPGESLAPFEDADLSYTCPPDEDLHIGSYGEVSLIAAKEFTPDRPSEIPQRFVEASRGRRMILVAMHSVVDWLSYAVWEDGKLVRALSLSPDSGVIEDIGPRMDFEAPYWSGSHPVDSDDGEDAYPLPFHPLDFGEIVLRRLVGFSYEGEIDPSLLEPFDVPLMRFKRVDAKAAAAASQEAAAPSGIGVKPWWKFW